MLLYTDAQVNRRLLELSASLTQRGPLTVLDGGNHFNVYLVAQSLRRLSTEVSILLKRIQVSRAFTCFQMAAMLAQTPSSSRPVLVLDLLSTFQDENVPLAERKRLLATCLPHLRRLRTAAPILVSISPGESGLINLLLSVADEIWQLETPTPPPIPRLFPE